MKYLIVLISLITVVASKWTNIEPGYVGTISIPLQMQYQEIYYKLETNDRLFNLYAFDNEKSYKLFIRTGKLAGDIRQLRHTVTSEAEGIFLTGTYFLNLVVVPLEYPFKYQFTYDQILPEYDCPQIFGWFTACKTWPYNYMPFVTLNPFKVAIVVIPVVAIILGALWYKYIYRVERRYQPLSQIEMI